MSRFSGLSKSAIWVAAGLLVGAGVGAGVGFLIINLNEKNEDYSFGIPDNKQDALGNDGAKINLSEFASNVEGRESIFGNHSERTGVWGISGINPSQGKKELDAVELGFNTLAYKIKTRLGYGPEVSLLKGIQISPKGNWQNANGVYIGATNEIFINSTNIINEVNQIKKSIGPLTKQEEIEFVAEFVFQIIAHEYNHHMAYTYLNSRFATTSTTKHNFFNSAPTLVDVKSDEEKGENPKNKAEKLTEAWDSDFYKTFVSALNYDDSDIAKSSSFMNNFYTTDANGKVVPNYKQGYDSNRNPVEPISKDFSAADIFKYANDENVKEISHTNGSKKTTWDNSKKYAFYQNSQVAIIYSQTDLMYQYSLAELYARKVQQLSMPTSLNYKSGGGDEYPLPEFRDILVGWAQEKSSKSMKTVVYRELDSNGNPKPLNIKMIGYDQLIWGNLVGNYSPFILDTKNYTDNWYTKPFTSDYLFYPDNTDINGTPDNSNAYAIYDSILQEMGYANSGTKSQTAKNVFNNMGVVDSTQQADISLIWWNNEEKVNTQGQLKSNPAETTKFNMGGYIDKKYDSIGYVNLKGEFVPLSKINSSSFTFGVKDRLINNKRDELYNLSRDKYFWTLEDYKDINSFKNQLLVFRGSKTDIVKDLKDRITSLQELLDKNKSEQDVAKKLFDVTSNIVTKIELKNEIDTLQKTIDKVQAAIDVRQLELDNVNASKSDEIVEPLTSYNSEATTWLSLDSVDQRSGINKHIAYPTYNSHRFGITLEVD